MDVLVTVVAWLVGVVLDALSMSALSVAWELLADVLFPKRPLPPLRVGVVAVVLGTVAGFVSIAVLPGRLLRMSPPTGASVIVAPLIAGALMERYGRWRAERGSTPSDLVSFEGGAAFAFGLASVRWWWALAAV